MSQDDFERKLLSYESNHIRKYGRQIPTKIEMIQARFILRPALLARFATRVWFYVIILIHITKI